MNDEIKETLDRLNKIVPYADVPKELAYMTTNITPQECKTLLNYITNLQQENERLKQPKIFIDTQDMEERYGEELYKDYLEKQVKDYKSRIEKAVEYIKELISATKGTLNDMNYCDKKETITQYVESLEYDINHYEYLLNILNGRSDK